MATDKKTILTALCLLVFAAGANAQLPGVKNVRMDSTVLKLNSMTLEDYQALVLPPLDTLYYNAFTMSNAVNFYNSEAEFYHREVLTQKRKPLDWIRLVGTYSYGNTDMAAITLMETTYQIWSQNSSSQRNSFYNFGVTVSIPLIDIFNTGNKVKQAQIQEQQYQYKKQEALDEIKKEIIVQYCKIVQQMNLLEGASQDIVMAQAHYSIAEGDFVNGKLTSEALYRGKNEVISAANRYEEIRKELNTAILTLEVISCTPIISK